MSYSLRVNKVNIDSKNLYSDTELVIKEHGITVIKGKNGCGKTTLINQLLYMYPESVMVISQDNDLIFEKKSLEQNVMLFGGDGNYLNQLLTAMHMEYLNSRNMATLSGGEKRIVSLLRLFFVDKDIIILDEPSNDLDYRSVDLIKKILNELAGTKAIIIVSHDDRIIEMADQVYQFSNGMIVADKQVDDAIHPLPVKVNNSNVGKIIGKDIITGILFAFIVLSVLGAGLAYFILKPTSIDYMMDDQTNLATKQYGSVKKMLEQGYLPMEAYREFKGTVGWDFYKTYSAAVNKTIMSGGTANMFIDETYGEVVFLSVIWNPIKDEKKYLLKDYQTVYENLYGERISLAENYSVFDGISEIAETYDDGKAYRIDPQLFAELENAYTSAYPDLQPVLYIVMNENSNRLEEADDNWFIRNNTTISIYNQINELLNLKNFLTILVLGGLGSFGIYMVYFIASLKLARKQVIVFRNMGIPYEKAFEGFFQKKCAPKRNGILCLAGILMSILVYVGTRDTLPFQIMLLTVIGEYIGITVICRNLLRRMVSTIYTFGGLYED